MVKRRWIWVLVFTLLVVVLSVLTTGWNLALVQDYHRLLKAARSIAVKDAEISLVTPRATILMGLLGFAVALGAMIVFFVRFLKEMQLNQLQSEFLASVSHALKTPIATIELSSGLLRAGDLSREETERLWDSHQSELKRLKEHVDSLLEAARLREDSIRPKKSLVSMEMWVASSSLRWRQILGPRAVFNRTGEPLACEAWLDPLLLNLITDNLIDNARKFARNHPEVTIESRLTSSHWTLKFMDCGWGFPPEDSERIFNRFFRSKTEAPYAIPGTGLGLYLVATAARSLGIKLTAQSLGVGQGAAFTLEGRRVPS